MRILIIIVLSFILGWYSHKTAFEKGLLNKSPLSIIRNEEEKNTNSKNLLIIYKDGKFYPSSASMDITRYLTIRNDSESLMMLTSTDDPDLSTPRGYGLKEEVKKRMDKPGTYRVTNKLNTNAQVVIQVIGK